MPLIVEIRRGGEWRPLGPAPEIPDGQLDGGATISHNAPAGRQIYWFACHGQHSTIKRSVLGVDQELGPHGMIRMLTTLDLETVVQLDETNPSCEFWIHTDQMREPHRIRFRHEPMDLGQS